RAASQDLEIGLRVDVPADAFALHTRRCRPRIKLLKLEIRRRLASARAFGGSSRVLIRLHLLIDVLGVFGAHYLMLQPTGYGLTYLRPAASGVMYASNAPAVSGPVPTAYCRPR